MNYTLNFQKQLGDRELVKRGGELRIEFDDDLGDVLSDASREDPPLLDFLVHRETGCIIPNCSTGKRDKIEFNLFATYVRICSDRSEPYMSFSEYIPLENVRIAHIWSCSKSLFPSVF